MVVVAPLLARPTGPAPPSPVPTAASVGRVPVGADAPRTATPHPASGHVNPFALISSEPAPMGIADFGVTGTTGVVHAYSYGTPEFEGNVTVDSMLTSIPGSSQTYMTFQLNVVVVYTLGGTNYSYWIQDIASIESSTGYTGWIDNIWNLSASGSGVGFASSGEISGNGTVNNYNGLVWYADSPGSSYPGSLVTLTYPTSVTIRTVSSTLNGYPHVGFEYNDGYGWVTFDNVTFEHMRYAVNHGFVVDGYQYTPAGIFYDAEWDYAGSGSGQHNVRSELNMSLRYWNGHNLESVPSAYNFGSDTAESLNNVIAGLPPAPADGSLYSHLTNGSGTLGLLYNQSSVAVVNVSTPTFAAGSIAINGSPTAFTGNGANLTLAPGAYSVALLNGSTLVDRQNFTFAAGSYTHLTIPFPHYPVTFHESGLPPGTAWSVALGGSVVGASATALNLSVENGSYAFHVLPVAGYVANVTGGALSVAGSPVVVAVGFTEFNFTAYFTETGLPAGTPWSVTLGGNATAFLAATGSLALPNGTYAYALATVNTYVASPPTGTFSVNGTDVGLDVSFVLHLGAIAGSLAPANATLEIDGGPEAVTHGAFNISEAPGTYTIEALARGFAPAWLNVTVTPGNVSWANFTLSALPPSAPVSSAGNTGAGDGLLLYGSVGAVVAAAAIGGIWVLRRRSAPPAP